MSCCELPAFVVASELRFQLFGVTVIITVILGHRRTQNFTMMGSRGGAWPGDLGDESLPVGYRGKAPVGGLVNEAPRS